MLDVSPFQEKPCAFSDAFPDEVLHIVGTQHDPGFGIFSNGVDVRRHIECLKLHYIINVFFQHLDQAVVEVLRNKALHMIRLVGEEVLESLKWSHSQIHVNQLDAGFLLVILRNVLWSDIELLAVDGHDFDLMSGVEQSRDDAVHGHRAAFKGRIG